MTQGPAPHQEPVFTTAPFVLTTAEVGRAASAHPSMRRLGLVLVLGVLVVVVGLAAGQAQLAAFAAVMVAISVVANVAALRRLNRVPKSWRFFPDGRFEVRANGVFGGDLRLVEVSPRSTPELTLVVVDGVVMAIPHRVLPPGGAEWAGQMLHWARTQRRDGGAAIGYVPYSTDARTTLPFGPAVGYLRERIGLLVAFCCFIAIVSRGSTATWSVTSFLLVLGIPLAVGGAVIAVGVTNMSRKPRTSVATVGDRSLVITGPSGHAEIPFERIRSVEERYDGIRFVTHTRQWIPRHAFADTAQRRAFATALRDASGRTTT